MRIAIVGIADRGTANLERVHLRVLADTNLSYYAILDTTYVNPNAVSNLLRHAFWFPPHQVNAGDNVVLYTGYGVQNSEANLFGGRNHFFYWGLQNTVWNKTGDCAVLLEIALWQTSRFE